jgi:Holliday junction resolvase-like predicted endonuclease
MKQLKSTAKIKTFISDRRMNVSYETNNHRRHSNLHRKRIGILGEDYACEYLESIGLSVFERNFAMKFGEIDIVAVSYETASSLISDKHPDFKYVTIKDEDIESSSQKVKKVYIVEVKTSVSHENLKVNAIENATFKKLQKVARLGEFYMKEKFPIETPFSICVCAVYLNKDLSLNKIDYIKDIEI